MYIDLKNDKDKIIKNLESIKSSINGCEDFKLENYKKKDTLIVFVDVINGFIGEGVYSNPLANRIFETINKLANNKQEIPCVAFADAHSDDSIEFQAHPKHALMDTTESELHESIKGKISKVFYKDSINGFFAEGFKEFFDDNKDVNNIIVTGLVTDICVLNFCLTLKTYCNQVGRNIDIHVPIDGVESFELETYHSVTLMNLVSASMLMGNGIKLYKTII